ncbi:MAG: hypothetical protein EBR82_42490 [Caulobacteraceae bacterium]|nr:hypothetical protein [Caulobacteraceae bacterium]
MRGRRGGRIGIPLGPLVGKAGGIWHLAEVLLAKKSDGWPTVTAAASSSRIAYAVRVSPAMHIQFTQLKVNGGTLS